MLKREDHEDYEGKYNFTLHFIIYENVVKVKQTTTTCNDKGV